MNLKLLQYFFPKPHLCCGMCLLWRAYTLRPGVGIYILKMQPKA